MLKPLRHHRHYSHLLSNNNNSMYTIRSLRPSISFTRHFSSDPAKRWLRSLGEHLPTKPTIAAAADHLEISRVKAAFEIVEEEEVGGGGEEDDEVSSGLTAGLPESHLSAALPRKTDDHLETSRVKVAFEAVEEDGGGVGGGGGGSGGEEDDDVSAGLTAGLSESYKSVILPRKTGDHLKTFKAAFEVVEEEEDGGGGEEDEEVSAGLTAGLPESYQSAVLPRKAKGKKAQPVWVCENCGATTGQWWGMCRSCKKMNTMSESVAGSHFGGKAAGEPAPQRPGSWLPKRSFDGGKPRSLAHVNRGANNLNWRLSLPGMLGKEIARVLGGGLVPGSLTLVGGDPGVGKSTLLLQIAGLLAEGDGVNDSGPVLYVSGEESMEQIKSRADRMHITSPNIFLCSSTNIKDILDKVNGISPRALVVDSIQTVYLEDVTGSTGSVMQVRECTSTLLRFAKLTSIPVLLIGHVTKTGDIAGPRMLEHIVDAVLYMEGERNSSYRLLRPVKNRFGSTDELGVLEMSKIGLQAVMNPSEMFLSKNHCASTVLTGIAIAAVLDGSRTFLIETQALCVSSSNSSSSHRLVNGVQASRIDMIISVLMKQAGLKLRNFEIYVNVVGGFQMTDTAGDVALAAAICSSFLEFPLPHDMAFIGEIGLGGELRMVPRIETRILAIANLGLKACIVPESAVKSLNIPNQDLNILGCRNLKEVICTIRSIEDADATSLMTD